MQPWPGEVDTVSLQRLRVAHRRHLGLRRDEQRGKPALATNGTAAAILDGLILGGAPAGAPAGSAPSPGLTASLVAAYQARGPDALAALRGPFVFALWESETDSLVVFRDPLGLMPLFYAVLGDGVAISPAIDSLLTCLGPAAAIDGVAVATWICGRWRDSSQTFYSRVRRLPPGHALSVRADGVCVRRYWEPDGQLELTYDEAEVEADRLLLQAIDRCLSLGPAGVFLSGGVDSATVAAVTTARSRAQHLRAPHALSLRFPHPDCDEGPTQTAVAAKLRLPQELATFDDAMPRGAVLGALSSSGETLAPWPNPWAHGYRFLAETAADQGCRVLLSGEGGNDWFDPGWIHAADLLRRFALTELTRFARALGNYYGMTRTRALKTYFWDSAGHVLLQEAGERVLNRFASKQLRDRSLAREWTTVPVWVAPSADLRIELSEHWLQQRPPAARGGPLGGAARRHALGNPYLHLVLEGSFALGRSVDLIVLDPFFDVDLVEFLFRLSPSVLLADGQAKGLELRLLKRYAPEIDPSTLRAVYVDQFFDGLIAKQGIKAFRTLDGLPILSSLDAVSADGLFAAIRDTPQAPQTRWIWYALAAEGWLQSRR